MKTYAKAKSPEFWQSVRTEEGFEPYRRSLEKLWEEFCTSQPMATRYQDFKLFYTTGDRKVYQKGYFHKRNALAASFFLSLIFPEEEKYLTCLQDQIFAICDEFSWCLPAHQKDFDGFKRQHIDLFAAETALNLSEIYVIMGERLEPLIRRRIRDEIRWRILNSIDSAQFKWESSGTNWTAVCTGGVAISLMNLFPEEATRLIPRFEKNMEAFLGGYLEDGVCMEGPLYWFYGFGFFVLYADRIRNFTDGRVDHFKNPKVRLISTFWQKQYLSGNCFATFSDAILSQRYPIGIIHYLKDEYPEDVAVYPVEYGTFTDTMARLGMLLRAYIWRNEDYVKEPEAVDKPVTYYAPCAQWLITRRPGYGFAAKGGHNEEPHNHNDLGSFVFARNGRQVLTDAGRGEYCRDYFRVETRYDYFHTSSRGHSVPIIDGKYQCFGRSYSAKDTSYENGGFVTDIAGGYDCPELKSLRRQIVLLDDGVDMTDTYDYSGTGKLTERFVALEEPEIRDGKLIFSDTVVTFDPACCTVRCTAEQPYKPDGIDYSDYSNKTVYYLIDFELNAGVREFSCTIR